MKIKLYQSATVGIKIENFSNLTRGVAYRLIILWFLVSLSLFKKKYSRNQFLQYNLYKSYSSISLL